MSSLGVSSVGVSSLGSGLVVRDLRLTTGFTGFIRGLCVRASGFHMGILIHKGCIRCV